MFGSSGSDDVGNWDDKDFVMERVKVYGQIHHAQTPILIILL